MKALGGATRATTKQLIGMPPLPVGPETATAIRKLVATKEQSAEEAQELQDAVAKAERISDEVRAVVTPSAVSTLPAAAKPDRTQTRNSHLKTLLMTPSGCDAMAQWTGLA